MYHCLIDDTATTLDRFTGCLLGGAIGDALGWPIEFDTASGLTQRLGEQPPVALAKAGAAVAEITDDTQMTLFTAEALIRDRARQLSDGHGDVITLMQRALWRWYHTQMPQKTWDDPRILSGALIGDRRLFVRRAPGNTCLEALGSTTRNTSKGCGAVMRMAPIGLAAGDPAWAFEVASESGQLTHHHPSGYLSGAYLAALISGLVVGQDMETAMAEADALLAQAPGSEETIAAVAAAKAVAAKGPPSEATIESLGGGWIGEEALAIALACTLTADASTPAGVAAALWRAAAHKGDSDSTAAITGNLLGVMVGPTGLPPAWVTQVELRDLIEQVAADLFAATVQGQTPDPVSYPAD
jgi:ADP-ribosyl-[dinitrogen reductase] hydrolase